MESSKTLSTQQLRLHFFDLEASIQSDASAYINVFARMYRRFQADGNLAPARQQIEFVLLTQADNAWGSPIMILDGKTYPLSDPTIIEKGYVYQVALDAILVKVRSHLLLSAAAVSFNDQGVILATDSTRQKTALALELVRRGFKFLSADIAALGRTDRRMHPFPRSLHIHPDTLELTGFPGVVAGASVWQDKLLLDIEEIQPGSMSGASDISYVVIVQHPTEGKATKSALPEQELGILVGQLDDNLLTAARQIEGVTEVHPVVDGSYPLLRLHAHQRTPVLPHLKALCQQKGILVLDVVRRMEEPPTVQSPAKLKAISRKRAVNALSQQFQGRYKSARPQKRFGNKRNGLSKELTNMVSQAKCYQLSVGPLSEMADLICGLVNADED